MTDLERVARAIDAVPCVMLRVNKELFSPPRHEIIIWPEKDPEPTVLFATTNYAEALIKSGEFRSRLKAQAALDAMRQPEAAGFFGDQACN